MILIVSDRKDIQAYYVMVELDTLGIAHSLFNVADFPTKSSVSQVLGNTSDHCSITVDGGSIIRASDVTAVWYRKPDPPKMRQDIDPDEREFTFHEIHSGVQGLYDALGHARWMNPIEQVRISSNKLKQLRLAARLGMQIPRTIFTNDEREARKFVDSIDCKVVYKPIGGRYLGTRSGPWEELVVTREIYTTLLDESTIDAGLQRLSMCPALLQQHIEKALDIRVTVVGDKAFSAEIHSQTTPETTIDWRRGKDPSALEHKAHELPPHVERQCLDLVKSLALTFGAIDLVKGKDGRYYFLEINPNGQYGWVEDLTGLAINKAIAGHLANSGGRRS